MRKRERGEEKGKEGKEGREERNKKLFIGVARMHCGSFHI